MSIDNDIEIVKVAAKRTRWVSAAITICALCQLTLFYNYNFSWYEQFAKGNSWAKSSEIAKFKHEKRVEHWLDSTYVDVPLIGVKVANADSTILGGAAMLVLSVWLFFASRRENHLVRLVLSDAQRNIPDRAVKRSLLRGVISSQVLSPTTGDDDALYSLDTHREARRRSVPRGINWGLRYLPSSVILMSLALDVRSAASGGFLYSPRLIPIFTIGLTSGVLCGYLSHLCYRFQQGTAAIIAEFSQNLESESPEGPPVASTPAPADSGIQVQQTIPKAPLPATGTPPVAGS